MKKLENIEMACINAGGTEAVTDIAQFIGGAFGYTAKNWMTLGALYMLPGGVGALAADVLIIRAGINSATK
jgi:hypothetical protein